MQDFKTSEVTFRRDHWSELLQGVAAANVFFPAAMVLIAFFSFAFGNHLATWILPVAGLSAFCGLRALGLSWRNVGWAGLLALMIHLGAYVISRTFFDCSYDGLAYHQEAVLQLASGWNPIFGNADTPGHLHELWINHYPKASWIAGAVVFLNCGHIEAAKLFNITLMVGAGAQVAATLFRLTTLRVGSVAFIAVMAALNPVFIYQSTTFYLDGLLGSLLTIIIAGLAVCILSPRRSTFAVVLIATWLVINLKFTGLVSCAALLGLAVLIVWRRQGLKPACKMAGMATISSLVAILALGYAPYVRNLRENGNPLYPVMGAPDLRNFMALERPANLNDHNRIMRFLISNFSRSERVRSPLGTTLKFPFLVERGEYGGLWVGDVESGGFGPLYGALLLLTGVGCLALVLNPATRSMGGAVLLIISCLAVSIFTIDETWWARYVPQAWLLPLVVMTVCWLTARGSVFWWLGIGMAGLALVNVLFVGCSFGRHEWGYSRATRKCLQEMTAARQPVTVYFGPFQSLRRRLSEANVDFKLVDTLPQEKGGAALHEFPSNRGQQFWIEQTTH